MLTYDHQHAVDLMRRRDFIGARDFLIGRQDYYINARPSLKAPYFATLGKVHSLLGHYDQADHCFDMSVQIDENNLGARLEMADSYLNRGKLNQAEELLHRVFNSPLLSTSRAEKKLYKVMGKFCKLAGDYVGAQDAYSEYLKRSAPNSTIIRDLNFLDSITQRYFPKREALDGTLDYAFELQRSNVPEIDPLQMAITFLENRLNELQLIESRFEVQVVLGQFYLLKGNIPIAKQYNDAALHIDPNHPKPLGARIRMMLPTETPEAVRAQYAEDRLIILQLPEAACKLATAFKHAGFGDLTQEISSSLLHDNRAPRRIREMASALLSSVDYSEQRTPA